MSKKKELIEVAPPQRIGVEKLVTRPHKCPYCSGKGWHWSDGPRGTEKKQCPDCRGAGMVRGVVSIHWVPAAMAGEAHMDSEGVTKTKAELMAAERSKTMWGQKFSGRL